MNRTLCLSVLALLLAGCESTDNAALRQQQQDYEAARTYKAAIAPTVARLSQAYASRYPKLILKAYDDIVLVAGEVDSAQAQQAVFAEVSAIPHAEVYTFTLVRQDGSSAQLAKDAGLKQQVSQLLAASYLDVYVVDGRLGVVGQVPASSYETLRASLTAIPSRVPGIQPDPHLVISLKGDLSTFTAESYKDMGDWAPANAKVAPRVRPTSLSGAVTSTALAPITPAVTASAAPAAPSYASTPAAAPAASQGSESGMDTVKMIGALAGVALGSKVAYDTGNAAQGQQVMQAAFNAAGIDTSSASGSAGAYSGGSMAGAGTQGGPSPRVVAAQQKTFSFAGNCPADASGVLPELSHPEIRGNAGELQKPIVDMARSAGGFDQAISQASAQKDEYIRAATEAAQQASDTWGGDSPLYDVKTCPQSEGIYCSGVQAMWLYSDMAIYTEYVKDALVCHKARGTKL